MLSILDPLKKHLNLNYSTPGLNAKRNESARCLLKDEIDSGAHSVFTIKQMFEGVSPFRKVSLASTQIHNKKCIYTHKNTMRLHVAYPVCVSKIITNCCNNIKAESLSVNQTG